MHVATVPDRREQADPDRTCLEDLDRSWTSAQFAAEVRRVAGGLAARGVRPGDVVGAMLPNQLELVVLMFAAWRLGVALTPVNPALTADEACYQLDDCSARLVIAEDDNLATVAGARAEVASLADYRALAGDPPPLRVQDDDVALVIYTSGTTGRPKGVVLDHANVSAMADMIVTWLGLGPDDRCLLVLPLFHVNGLMASVVSPLAAGGTTIVAPRFAPDRFWAWVERFRPTYFSAVPTIYLLLNNEPADAVPDTSSLRFVVCGAAPMPVEAITAFEARYRVPLVEGYGLSEGTVASTINPLDGPRKPGTVGPALPGQTVAVVDDAGRSLPPGQVGEVVIKGPNIMRGYLGRDAETAATLRDGWLHTGDVGHLDADGYLTLVDRVKDMIIRGGENIYPKEIESVLYAHPAVLEAAVVGKPDPVYGEQPVAFVSLRPGQQVTADELDAYCRDRLAGFKRPREYVVLDTLPKNPVGKITKPQLRDLVRGQG
jgi:O-succinylbenzoate-CoA ligase